MNEIRPSFLFFCFCNGERTYIYVPPPYTSLKRHNKKLKINSINITHPHRKSIFKISLNFHSFFFLLLRRSYGFSEIFSRQFMEKVLCANGDNRNGSKLFNLSRLLFENFCIIASPELNEVTFLFCTSMTKRVIEMQKHGQISPQIFLLYFIVQLKIHLCVFFSSIHLCHVTKKCRKTVFFSSKCHYLPIDNTPASCFRNVCV